MTRIAAVLLLLGIGGALPPERAQAQATPWLDSAWSSRVALTMATPVDTTMTDVVLLVSGQNAQAAFASAKSDGSDLRVTRGDGTSVVPHHLIGYNGTGQALELWFEAPVVSAANTKFYLYYGNPAAADQSDPGGTWSGFDAVYVFENTPGGALPDQTVNDNDAGRVQGTWNASHLVAGKVGRAWSYGSGRTMGVWQKQITSGAEWTVSSWVRLVGRGTDFLLQGNPCFFSLHVQASNISWDTGQYKNDYCPSLGWGVRTNQNVAIDSWHHHAWATDATDSTITYFYDGSHVPYNTATNRNFPNVQETPNERWKCHPIGSTSEGVGIGSTMYPNNQDDMNGDVDHFTIRSWKVPAKLLAVEHANQSDPGAFWVEGAPEDRPAPSAGKSIGHLKATFQDGDDEGGR